MWFDLGIADWCRLAVLVIPNHHDMSPMFCRSAAAHSAVFLLHMHMCYISYTHPMLTLQPTHFPMSCVLSNPEFFYELNIEGYNEHHMKKTTKQEKGNEGKRRIRQITGEEGEGQQD